MKKIIFTLTILVAAFFGLSAYANDNDGKIPETVSSAFSKNFQHARRVRWDDYSSYYKATFMVRGTVLYAFYSADADLMGTGKNILSTSLPVKLKNELSKDYSSYWISDLFEYSVNGGKAYCVTLENADQKISLKSEGSGWYFYKKLQK